MDDSMGEKEIKSDRKIYCIWVKTGLEEHYVKKMQPLLDGAEEELSGTLYVLKKKMRLKNGKEYFETLFPGYVFFETSESDTRKFKALCESDDFIRILPETAAARFLCDTDATIVKSVLQYGSTIDILHVEFNKDDKIVITDGPFKNFTGKVVAVNRRNKRVNIQFDFMNGLKVVGLSYEVVSHAK